MAPSVSSSCLFAPDSSWPYESGVCLLFPACLRTVLSKGPGWEGEAKGEIGRELQEGEAEGEAVTSSPVGDQEGSLEQKEFELGLEYG